MKTFSLLESWWQFVLMAIVCYAIGCINFALVISRSKKKDITKMGSGNPGTMNMSREFGLKFGLLTFVCDAIKGGLPALVSYFIYRNYVFAGTDVIVSDITRYFCGLFVVIGHIFPVQMRFKGGKGIASTLGLFWFSLSCESAWWALGGVGIAALLIFFIYATEWGSLGSLLGVTGCSIIQLFSYLLSYGQNAFNAYLVWAYLLIFIVNVLTWVAHRKNLYRLFAGEEHRTSIKKLSKKR